MCTRHNLLALYRLSRIALVLFAIFGLALSMPARAQSAQDMTLYTDSLQNGWQDWSWTARNLAQTTPIYSGTDSIEVDFGAWQGLQLHHDAFVASAYTNLSFYVHGGAAGGQRFIVAAVKSDGTIVGTVPVTNYISGGTLPAGQWVFVTIPLSDLHADTLPDLSAFQFQDSTGAAQPALYLDQITLTAPAPPASTSLTVNNAQTIRTVDRKIFGVNTAIWDSILDTDSTKQMMLAAGPSALRFPGGSTSDAYDWTKQQWPGQNATPQFGDLAATLGADAFLTVNYGTGTVQQAAAWVAYCNATSTNTAALGIDANGQDWKTGSYWAQLRGSAPLPTDDGLNFLRAGHAAPYGFHFWEIGNECYGSWENDTHAQKQDGVIYANFAASAAALMKSVDPTIAVGTVVTAGEDDAGNQAETVTNPVTGKTHKGWTSVLLSTLAGLGYTPDFVIYHNYAQNAGGESDNGLLHSASLWPSYAATLRTMLTQYLGATASANVLLTSTENNSVSDNPGKQTTSLVNGLYYADSTGSILQTEFTANIWWDMHNGTGTGGNLSSTLYGWRQYSDYGVLSSGATQPGATVPNTPYPAYFGMKLLSKFARGGDAVIAASSSYTNLSVYAARQSGGALALLVVNKDSVHDLPATVALNGFATGPTAMVFQYGKAQDTAQSQGSAVDLAQSTLPLSGSPFAVTFPSYSMTVLVIPPAAAPAVTVQSLSLAPTSVKGGASSTGTITLTGPAPAGGLAVKQTSSDLAAVTLAPTLNIPAGATSAKFKITTKSIPNTEPVTIISSVNGASVTATLTVTGTTPPVTVTGLSLSPTSVKGGAATSTGTITLSGPAPVGGVSVTQTSSDTTAATLAPKLNIPAGATSAKFKITTTAVSTTKTVTITSSLNGTSKTAILTVTH